MQLAFLRLEHCNLSHKPKKPEHHKATHHRMLQLRKIKLNTKWETLGSCQILSLCSGDIWLYNYTLSNGLCMQNNTFLQKNKTKNTKIKLKKKIKNKRKNKSTNKILSKWVLHKLLFFARKILQSLAVKNPYYHILFCCLLSKTLLGVSRLVLVFHQAVREKSCGLLPPTSGVSLALCQRNKPSTKAPLDKKQEITDLSWRKTLQSW